MEISCQIESYDNIPLSEAKKKSIFASVTPCRRKIIRLQRINVADSVRIPYGQ